MRSVVEGGVNRVTAARQFKTTSAIRRFERLTSPSKDRDKLAPFRLPRGQDMDPVHEARPSED
jgi:hypothetical protein